jgi:GGDEF domain-containing protein
MVTKEQLNINGDEIKFKDLTILHVTTPFDFKIFRIAKFDAVIIHFGDTDFISFMVKKIRAQENPNISLVPIFLLNMSQSSDIYVKTLIDGVLFSLEQIDLIEDTIRRIKAKRSELYVAKSISFEAKVINRTFNLLYTRDKKVLQPFPYHKSVIGYIFPELSLHFSENDENQVFKILEIIEKENLVSSTFFQRIYTCTSCNGGILNYREVCPKCQSSNSQEEDLVHHFPCAYVGPIKDFKNKLDDDLNCPKCNKHLKHIGVDYDKPSILYTCNACSHKYQDFNVKAKCLVCLQDNEVETLAAKAINTYEITKKGEDVALNGYLSTSVDLDEMKGTVSFSIFKVMLNYELERLKQNNTNSNIAYIKIANAGEIYSRIGSDRQKALIAEFIQLLRTNLRSSDFITFYNSSTLIMSLNEIPEKVAKNILLDIKELVVKLMTQNFKHFETNIVTNVFPLNTEISHELQLQILLEDTENG